MKSALRTNFGRQGWPRVGQREIMSCTVVLTKLSAKPMGALELAWHGPSELSQIMLWHWFRQWIWAAPERRKKKQYSSATVVHKEGWYLRVDLALFPAASEMSPLFPKGDPGIWILFRTQWGATAEFSEWGVVVWFTCSYDYSGYFLKNTKCRSRIKETKYSICGKAKGSVRFAQCYFLLMAESHKTGTSQGKHFKFRFSVITPNKRANMI